MLNLVNCVTSIFKVRRFFDTYTKFLLVMVLMEVEGEGMEFRNRKFNERAERGEGMNIQHWW